MYVFYAIFKILNHLDTLEALVFLTRPVFLTKPRCELKREQDAVLSVAKAARADSVPFELHPDMDIIVNINKIPRMQARSETHTVTLLINSYAGT